ncbi:hypothetical protein T06_3050 [Trichinella sp. T6]|nr:hypothetical protein T06_3050 [Trichinella sp. T6]
MNQKAEAFLCEQLLADRLFGPFSQYNNCQITDKKVAKPRSKSTSEPNCIQQQLKNQDKIPNYYHIILFSNFASSETLDEISGSAMRGVFILCMATIHFFLKQGALVNLTPSVDGSIALLIGKLTEDQY